MPTTTRGFKQHPKSTAREHLVLRHTERVVSQRPRLGLKGAREGAELASLHGAGRRRKHQG
jgi:hypothetical protein